MLAILKTCSNASSKGLQTTGVFGSTRSASGQVVYSSMSKTSLSSPSTGSFPLLAASFKVSKHMILSKQSSNPSLLRTRLA